MSGGGGGGCGEVTSRGRSTTGMYIYIKDKWVYRHRSIIARFGIGLGGVDCCPSSQMD